MAGRARTTSGRRLTIAGMTTLRMLAVTARGSPIRFFFLFMFYCFLYFFSTIAGMKTLRLLAVTGVVNAVHITHITHLTHTQLLRA
jgi:hypothetical protein